MTNKEIVYKITSFIPKGKALTYGGLARLAGLKSSRLVGNILHQNNDPKNIPCHRIVSRHGEAAENFAFGGANSQLGKLLSEGVKTKNHRVDLTKSLWQPSIPLLLYFNLLNNYGEPGPWPWFPSSLNSSGQVPSTSEEIAIGAILTQNTNWKNVENVLDNLKKEKICNLRGIYNLEKTDYNKLKILIRPAGFYNQKANYLFGFCKYIIKNFKTLENFSKLPLEEAREKLLKLPGIGKETADTILLYAGNKPIFVIDAYTKRFAKFYNLETNLSYDNLQKIFTENLPEDTTLYQNYHALVVRWGKENKA